MPNDRQYIMKGFQQIAYNFRAVENRRADLDLVGDVNVTPASLRRELTNKFCDKKGMQTYFVKPLSMKSA